MVSAGGVNQSLYEDERYDDVEEDVDDFVEYDITATPNDFNLSTLISYMDAGALVIPGFQRNYVWDIKRASMLIESLIRGLPVPQLFLYEAERNKFLVIDGQQRLMSIYYFFKQRFPRQNSRPHLRAVFQKYGHIPRETLDDDDHFSNFRLHLPVNVPGKSNKFHGADYDSLGESQMQFNLRPLRNIVIRQNSPSDEDSAMYEIFNRLNSGGVNLRPQEIRLCLYHSDFYDMLERINTEPVWRRFLRNDEPDLHMKDIEVLLRVFAMLVDSERYAPSLVKFLNRFSNDAKSNTAEENQYLELLFKSFLSAADHLSDDTFINKRNGRINIALIESVFFAACKDSFEKGEPVKQALDAERIRELETDAEFVDAASVSTTTRNNVNIRLQRGMAILG